METPKISDSTKAWKANSKKNRKECEGNDKTTTKPMNEENTEHLGRNGNDNNLTTLL